ncbi:NAD+ synthase [Taibaiella chishuiensis]|uniref:Glutamine-dependent NAD(+) synthetase n=1 Tax=Taibaiella chishuiensis TaxID=1434707 RepID=A0A2P8DA13_9BACT|nr:NAD+ synthase [Taibaiella chishuiensis]PSK94052.1 NAD+ synthase (glutamine-hydrolysing) [Taibaiella chishuiensis]
MKIFLAQQNYHIGNFEANTRKIIDAIRAAKEQGGDLVVFSELAVCGYPPRDFLEFEDFVDSCLQAVDEISREANGIAVLVGAPSRNPQVEGKDLFNSAYFLAEGRIQQVIHKTLLPNYDVFDEYRYFEPAYEWAVVPFKGKKLAVTICEDIWDIADNPLYRSRPMDRLMAEQPDIMINLSASPFDYVHAENRLAVVKKNVARYRLPMIYCNTVGSQTEIVFDGGSLVCDAEGNLVKEMGYFREELAAVHWDLQGGFTEQPVHAPAVLPGTALTTPVFEPLLHIDRIHDALVMGIRQYFEKMGFKQAIVASSGGIDSAVTLALACRALGPENVHALLMPSQFSTDHSVSDAEQLSKNLANRYDILPIKPIFDQFELSLQPIFEDRPFNVAEENIQSRIRGALAMALSNKFNYILLNTSNKSELATGYGTLYGDMAGGLGVLGDLYKMQVFALARFINKDGEIIPENIITKPPSAELRPGQKDSDSLPDYAIMDAILYQYVERRQGAGAIVAQGFDEALVHRILQMVNRNEYKRNQFCPIIRVSSKSFGIGRRIPIVARYFS